MDILLVLNSKNGIIHLFASGWSISSYANVQTVWSVFTLFVNAYLSKFSMSKANNNQHSLSSVLNQPFRDIHHNLFITLLLGSKAETVLVKHQCYIQTKMSWLNIKIFYKIYIFLGSIFKACYIQNQVIMNGFIKRYVWSPLKVNVVGTC